MDTLAQIIVQETTDSDGCLVPSVPVYILGTDVPFTIENSVSSPLFVDVVEEFPSTGTVTSVSASASNGTILAANTGRRGATVYNDSLATLYLKLGSSSSTTSFTLKVAPGAYYEVPFGYTGIITGLWTSATGDARVTELT